MNRTIAILGIIAIAVLAVGSAIGGSMFYFGHLSGGKTVAAKKPTVIEHCLGKV